MGTSSPRFRLLVLSPSSLQLILVAANIEYTWARSAPASCDFVTAGRRRLAQARGSLNIVSPFALKILFHCYMHVKCVLLFVVIEKIVNAHAGKPRTVNAYFYNIIMSDCLYKFYKFLLSIMGFLSISLSRIVKLHVIIKIKSLQFYI